MSDMIYRFLERPLVEDKPQAPSTLNTEGIEIPKNRQVPLLDCHDRSSTDNQIGSVINMRVENNGLEVLCQI